MALRERDWPEGPKSGRLLLRMPSTLHEDAARAASAEGVSLNLFICTTLARALEWDGRDPPGRSVRKVRQEIGRGLWMERHGVGRRYNAPGNW